MSGGAEHTRETRRRHPERARLQKRIDVARTVAYHAVAARHPGEFERLFKAELERRGLPRYLPPLPRNKDRRHGVQEGNGRR